MTDTDILNDALRSLRYFAVERMPISPSLCAEWADWIDEHRVQRRKQDVHPIGAGVVTNTAETGVYEQRADEWQQVFQVYKVDASNSNLCPKCRQPSLNIPRMGIYHICEVEPEVTAARKPWWDGCKIEDATYWLGNDGSLKVIRHSEPWVCPHGYEGWALEDDVVKCKQCDELRGSANACKPQTS